MRKIKIGGNADMRLKDMKDEELKILANKRKKNGSFTSQAIKAQTELWNRTHYKIDNVLEEYCGGYYDDGYSEYDILSMQY